MATSPRMPSTPPPASGSGTARPLREIVAQPALRASVFGAAVGYATMNMVMTATPLPRNGASVQPRMPEIMLTRASVLL